MTAEYDFSNAERGKFFCPDAKFNLAAYPEEEVLEFFSHYAIVKGTDLNASRSNFSNKDIDLIADGDSDESK
jgi:hypothetical protein